MSRFADIRVHIELPIADRLRFSWQCEHCGTHGLAYEITEASDVLYDLAMQHAQCPGLLLTDAVDDAQDALDDTDAAFLDRLR